MSEPQWGSLSFSDCSWEEAQILAGLAMYPPLASSLNAHGNPCRVTLYTSRHNNPHPRLQQPRSAAGKKGDYENLLQEMKAKQAEARGSFHILGVRRRRE